MGAKPPESRPLETPAQLLAWAACCPPEELDPMHRLCRGSVPLPPRQQGPCGPSGPRLLACHDMAGGYGDDRLVQGGTNPDFYVLRRWACLDTFVYFSHRLVTIPPPGWINAAHTHGVRVLGTLITEWEAGACACAELFGSAEAAAAAAEALARVAVCYGFEGWLVNIENGVQPGHIPNLLHFLRVLTERMRDVAPGWSQVVWYDAVTTEGKLEWQNGLTSLNRPFFDACDALWVNYTWREGTPAAVKQAAGKRAADVYMGVDCFGRGTYGGGGFNCGAALRASLEQGLSAALFAVGWPYEGDCGPDAPTCWRRRDDAFWAGIEQAWRQGWRSCGSGAAGAGSAGAAGSAQSGPRLQLPLYSNFCRGSGRALFQTGRVLSGQPWYNLSLQTPQPILAVKLLGEPGGGSSRGSSTGAGESGGGGGSGADSSAAQARCPVHVTVCAERAFSGGSSLCIGGALRPRERATVRLFEPRMELPAQGAAVRLTASRAGSVGLRLALHLAPACSADVGDGAADGDGSGATQAAGAALIMLTPLFSAAPGQAAAAAAAKAARAGDGAPATASPGRQIMATLSATASRRVAAHAVQAGGSGSDASASAAMPEWQTFEFSLAPGVLLDTGSTVLLAAVDLLLEGPPAGSTRGSTGPSSFTAHLGELCIEARLPGSPPAAPGSVADLACEGLQLKRDGACTDSGDSGDWGCFMLTARLSWQAPVTSVRCCHIWCAFDGGAAAPAAAAPCWLAVACADAFCVSGLPVPAGAAAVTFWVQPEGRNGLVQELAAAACMSVSLEQQAAA